MAMDPCEFDRRYGEMQRVVNAHLGRAVDASNGEETPDAVQAYIRHTWYRQPWLLAVAEQQLREYARHPPGRLRLRLGEYYRIPDVGLPEAEIQDWLVGLADAIRHGAGSDTAPRPCSPQTHWEWHARFPELGQLLGGWFSQDMPDEFVDHMAALDDYLGSTSPDLVARLCGELYEVLALSLAEEDYAHAITELGMEVDPPAPYTAAAWLALVAERVADSSSPEGRSSASQGGREQP
ncbi:contact-dependent growth inhibition system immunity protein [Streptomyces sp. NPDC006992]|uniref:contact-dependent growth inhibition system immunity protein n=1 Tax=Streptomyces sp. NPDC006992 TaxID=3155601 RepID=UPI0033FCF344